MVLDRGANIQSDEAVIEMKIVVQQLERYSLKTMVFNFSLLYQLMFYPAFPLLQMNFKEIFSKKTLKGTFLSP